MHLLYIRSSSQQIFTVHVCIILYDVMVQCTTIVLITTASSFLDLFAAIARDSTLVSVSGAICNKIAYNIVMFVCVYYPNAIEIMAFLLYML